jgi:hypothetical protein
VQVSSHFPTNAITSRREPYSLVAVVRDEEAVGSNPATPTHVVADQSPYRPCRSGALFGPSPQLVRSNVEGGLPRLVESGLDKLKIIGEEVRVGVQCQRSGLVSEHSLNALRVCAAKRRRGPLAAGRW